MKFLFIQLLAIYSNFAIAQTFSSVEAYLTHVTNAQPVLSKEVALSDAKSVFGTVRWNLPEYDPIAEKSELASVFVLEKFKDNTFREVVRSTPFAFSTNPRAVFDGVATESNSKFYVSLHRSSPLGTIKYRFAQLRQAWQLSGREDVTCYHRDDDEAHCDTRVERSTNFLKGKIIEKYFRRNRLVSTKYSKRKFPKFPLAEFRVFDERHGDL
jgi:hypothetical protein